MPKIFVDNGGGAAGGSGDVTGPGSSTDEAIARFNGTSGKILQDSSVLIDDSDNITGAVSVTIDTLILDNSNADVGLAREAAGVVRVTDGSTGISDLLHTVLVEANTAVAAAPNAITAIESGTVFTNEGAAAENVHDLPTAVAGLQYTFIVQDADGIQVNAATADTIRHDGTVSASAGLIESATIGNVVTLVAINATEWIATTLVGAWTIT